MFIYILISIYITYKNRLLIHYFQGLILSIKLSNGVSNRGMWVIAEKNKKTKTAQRQNRLSVYYQFNQVLKKHTKI